jgi:glyoxylase-like metal-dependent hydrolase (beta-lactamase superfamily II)
MITRRQFCTTLTAVAAMPLFNRRGLASQIVPVYTFGYKKLDSLNALVLTGLEEGGNVLILPSEKGTIVVDAKFAYSGPDFLKDVQTHIAGDPDLVINTHHHLDHSGGNWALKPLATIVAHKNFNPRIEANLPRYVTETQNRAKTIRHENWEDPRLAVLNDIADKLKTFTASAFSSTQQVEDSLTLDHGGVDILIHHFGNGHTDNDLVVYFPELNVMHVGDLMFNNLHPFVDRLAKATTVGWQKSLKKAMELGNDKTVVIPGHGEIGNKDSLQQQWNYFEVTRAAVEKAMKEGRSREFVKTMHPEQFIKYGFEGLQPLTLGVIYDELSEGTS